MTEPDPTPIVRTGALEIDLSPYMPLFEDEAISDADKMALLEALWSIIMSFVQIGWGVHPVQQARAARDASRISCGQEEGSIDPDDGADAIMLNSKLTLLTGQFDTAADHSVSEARVT